MADCTRDCDHSSICQSSCFLCASSYGLAANCSHTGLHMQQALAASGLRRRGSRCPNGQVEFPCNCMQEDARAIRRPYFLLDGLSSMLSYGWLCGLQIRSSNRSAGRDLAATARGPLMPCSIAVCNTAVSGKAQARPPQGSSSQDEDPTY